MSEPRNWGEDRSSHHLIVKKVEPASIRELSRELLLHKDIYDAAIQGRTFEECIAIIAEKLDILLDGLYDADKLAEMLVEALRNRRFHGNEPWKRAKGLVAVELVEREKSVTVEVVTEGTIAPTATIPSDADKEAGMVELCSECKGHGCTACKGTGAAINQDETPATVPQESPSQEPADIPCADLQNPAEEHRSSSTESADSVAASSSDKSD